MRKSIIRRKLAKNQPVLLMTLHFTDPVGFELASLMGFDGLWIDLEHHSHSVETAQTMMRAARIGTSDIVARPAKGEFMRVGRLLEAGAQGIIYPRIDNAEEARELVQWAKFPPIGKRGVDGGNPDMPYCSMPLAQYIREANENTFILAQLEEEAAINNVQEILAVEGIDGVFLGPGDYSSIGGFPGEMEHPSLHHAMKCMASAAKATGKHWGRPAAKLEDAQTYMEMGAKIISHSGDLLILKAGLEEIQTRFSKVGFEFDNRLRPCEAVPSLYRA